MTLTHVRDFVGQHHDLITINGKKTLKKGLHKGGLLITDFLVNQNLLYLCHGPVVSIVDINNSKHSITHLKLDKTRKSCYDMSPDVMAVMMLDKESTKVDQRWKVVVVFNGSEVRKITTKAPNKAEKFKQIRDGSAISDFELSPFLIDEKG
jgi:hypothetical protein